MCSYGGAALMAIALVILIVSLALMPALGAGILFLLAVFVGLAGLQLLALGIVGEYVWRALDEARRRPAYLIEAAAGQREAAHASPGTGGRVGEAAKLQ